MIFIGRITHDKRLQIEHKSHNAVFFSILEIPVYTFIQTYIPIESYTGSFRSLFFYLIANDILEFINQGNDILD